MRVFRIGVSRTVSLPSCSGSTANYPRPSSSRKKDTKYVAGMELPCSLTLPSTSKIYIVIVSNNNCDMFRHKLRLEKLHLVKLRLSMAGSVNGSTPTSQSANKNNVRTPTAAS